MDVSQNSTVKGRYLRGNGKLIAEDIAGSLSYYFFNAHGDVINRVNGSNGAVLKTYNYDSFGNIINPPTVGDPNDPLYVDQSPFGYAGEYLDKENGEIYLRARYYSSANGRFVTEDPAKYGANWYIYCDNNPVTMVDRTGLRPTTDGSAGSDKIANDYMFETYHKQVTSVPHPAREPEPPKPEPPKPSKPTQKSPSTPSYIKQYNPDHNEFEPPFDIENTIAKPDIDNNEDIKTNGTGLQEFVESATSTVTIDKMAETATEFWANSIVRHSVLEVAKTFDDILRFTPIVGTALDVSLRVFQGEELHHAANKAMIVTLTVSAVTIGIVSAGFAVPMFPIMVLLSVFIDLVVSSVYDKLLKN